MERKSVESKEYGKNGVGVPNARNRVNFVDKSGKGISEGADREAKLQRIQEIPTKRGNSKNEKRDEAKENLDERFFHAVFFSIQPALFTSLPNSSYVNEILGITYTYTRDTSQHK